MSDNYGLQYFGNGNWDWSSALVDSVLPLLYFGEVKQLQFGGIDEIFYSISKIEIAYVSVQHFYIVCYNDIYFLGCIDILKFMGNFCILYWKWHDDCGQELLECPVSAIGFDIL